MNLFAVPVLAAHLLCMNIAAAGPLVCIWLEWREGHDERTRRVASGLAHAAWGTLLLGALLGLGAGWHFWNAEYALAVRRLQPKLISGAAEWVFSLVCLMLYALWRSRSPHPRPGRRALRSLLPLLAGTNLLYHFPFLFAVLSALASARVAGEHTITPAEFRPLMVRGEILAQAFHFILASFAAAGVLMIGLGRSRSAEGADPEEAAVAAGPRMPKEAIWGARLALVASLLQIPVGIWLLSQQRPGIQTQLLGGDWLATSLLATGILLTLGLLHGLAALSGGERNRWALRLVPWAFVMIVILMTALLQQTKSRRGPDRSASLHAAPVRAYLSPAGSTAEASYPDEEHR